MKISLIDILYDKMIINKMKNNEMNREREATGEKN
jgi:hypothetical protein